MLNTLYKIGEAPPPVPYGTHLKPTYCANSCTRAYVGSGFVADHVPTNPKIAFMASHPSKDDVTRCQPFAGGYGRFFWAALAAKIGFKKEDVILSHLLRCYTWKYPIGHDSKQAEQACRYWDNFYNSSGHPIMSTQDPGEQSLITWRPNLFIVTFPIDKMVEVGAYQALALKDIEKAWRFAQSGYRPLVLLGTEVMAAVAPWLTGGAKSWRGHWWEGDWKWRNAPVIQKGFTAAVYKPVIRGRGKTKVKKSSKQQELFT